MNVQNKNLVCVIFPKTDRNKDLVSLLDACKPDYNFELKYHKVGDTLDLDTTKSQYDNRIVIFFLDRDDDLNEMRTMFNNYKDKLIIGHRIILCAPWDVSKYKDHFNANWVIDVSNYDAAKRNLCKVFDECFKGSRVEGKLGGIPSEGIRTEGTKEQPRVGQQTGSERQKI